MALSWLLPLLYAALLFCFLFVVRLYIVVKNGSTRASGNKAPVTVLAVVGSGNAKFLFLTYLTGLHPGTFVMTFALTVTSGGHTTEILRLMEALSAVYTPRHYVIADTDRMGEDKIRTFEASRQSANSQVRVFRGQDPFQYAKKNKIKIKTN